VRAGFTKSARNDDQVIYILYGENGDSKHSNITDKRRHARCRHRSAMFLI
jgi:hypothetical protein